MTKKDYELIAQALYKSKPQNDKALDAWAMVVRSLYTELRIENPKFNTTRFIKACHGE